MGQAQEDPHRKDSKEKREGISLVVMDYMYMKSKEGKGRTEEEESSDEEEDEEGVSKRFGLPTLVMRDVDALLSHRKRGGNQTKTVSLEVR